EGHACRTGSRAAQGKGWRSGRAQARSVIGPSRLWAFQQNERRLSRTLDGNNCLDAASADAALIAWGVVSLRAPYLELWPPLAALARTRTSSSGPPFPFADPECRLYAKGRHALWDGLRSAGLGGRAEEILVPAFNCGSEV